MFNIKLKNDIIVYKRFVMIIRAKLFNLLNRYDNILFILFIFYFIFRILI